MIHHLIAITLALIIDQLIGDPPWLPHPVRGFGKLIAFFEKKFNHGPNRMAKGTLMVFLVLLITGALSFTVVLFSYQLNEWLGVAIEGLFISTTIAVKGLKEAGISVLKPLEDQQLELAREKLSWIVGRDTDQLGESEIVRGAVETVAENTSDGITAPLFYALIGGAPLALLYRAVNTCDSMVGYKNDRYLLFGRASARLDDVMNFLPSRITGLLMVLLNPTAMEISKNEAFSVLFRDAKKHPSPNSGWGEAAVAGLLGVQLGGVNTYKGKVSNRAKMGNGHYPLKASHISQTISIMERTTFFFYILLLVIGGAVYGISRAWS
ncbi:adenosylcobinamide-phosphate synthase CbiB [Fictibacillus gelatini]|uniref:adenosylcobinamide-phosphate synthase CbiB n=1 Tax=Fictibacillus gelatini TaxID=225985 RepID=UPI000411F3AF|nr:adenosylcobinamide-phosphate synthase CbiB [Fictibacillus gelatini]